jgi:nucleotide-binding universal stress UspA family protein
VRLRRKNDDGLAVRRVLVATDRSETAERAVRFATDMAERYGAELFVLRVLLSDDGTRAEAARELAEYAESLAGERGRSSVVIGTDPAEAIVESARREKADVLSSGASA